MSDDTLGILLMLALGAIPIALCIVLNLPRHTDDEEEDR